MEEQIKHVIVETQEMDSVNALALRVIHGVDFTAVPTSKQIVETAKFATMLSEFPPDHIPAIIAMVQVTDETRQQSEFRACYLGHPQQMMGIALLSLCHVIRGAGFIKLTDPDNVTEAECVEFISKLFALEKQAREEHATAAGGNGANPPDGIIATDNPVH